MVRASGDAGSTLTRLMTVEATDSRVEDVPALADPSYDASTFSYFLKDTCVVNSSSGAKWLFVGDDENLTVVPRNRHRVDANHRSGAGWSWPKPRIQRNAARDGRLPARR